ELDSPRGVILAAGHDAALDELAAFDGPHVSLPRFRANGRCRQRRHWSACGERDAARGEHASTERAVPVRDADIYEDGAGSRLGGRIDPLDTAGEPALTEAVDRELDGLAYRELGNVHGGHSGLQLHVGQVDDGDERRIERDLLADLDVALGDDSIERRQGLRIAQRIA